MNVVLRLERPAEGPAALRQCDVEEVGPAPVLCQHEAVEVDDRDPFGREPDDSGAAVGSTALAQEQRVARLVADGLSNKEIAARLVVSTKTVEGHLRTIFVKLGATSRTQVARAVAR